MLGLLIKSLGGDEETVSSILSSLGKVIENVNLDNNELIFTFTDGSGLKVFDDGQCCCEDRYMTTDDDLSDYKGSTLLDFELKTAPNMENEHVEHEVKFLDVKTSNGIFQMASHNEHNGYYGGFNIVANIIKNEK